MSKPDLVILEAAMPDDDGIGALHELRHTVRLGNTPVIMLTAKADLQTVSRALQNQVSDYILNCPNRRDQETPLTASGAQ